MRSAVDLTFKHELIGLTDSRLTCVQLSIVLIILKSNRLVPLVIEFENQLDQYLGFVLNHISGLGCHPLSFENCCFWLISDVAIIWYRMHLCRSTTQSIEFHRTAKSWHWVKSVIHKNLRIGNHMHRMATPDHHVAIL
jgi:hypothetical protein